MPPLLPSLPPLFLPPPTPMGPLVDERRQAAEAVQGRSWRWRVSSDDWVFYRARFFIADSLWYFCWSGWPLFIRIGISLSIRIGSRRRGALMRSRRRASFLTCLLSSDAGGPALFSAEATPRAAKMAAATAAKAEGESGSFYHSDVDDNMSGRCEYLRLLPYCRKSQIWSRSAMTLEYREGIPTTSTHKRGHIIWCAGRRLFDRTNVLRITAVDEDSSDSTRLGLCFGTELKLLKVREEAICTNLTWFYAVRVRSSYPAASPYCSSVPFGGPNEKWLRRGRQRST